MGQMELSNAFKQRFCPSTWARYDLAVPGTMRLLPSAEEHLKSLAQDYKDMAVMLSGKTNSTFEEIIILRELETRINSLGTPLGESSTTLKAQTSETS